MAGTTKGRQKTSEGGRGNTEKARPTAVGRYMKGIKFPAAKKQLVEQDKENNSPQDIMSVLNKFKEKNTILLLMSQKNLGELIKSQNLLKGNLGKTLFSYRGGRW